MAPAAGSDTPVTSSALADLIAASDGSTSVPTSASTNRCPANSASAFGRALPEAPNPPPLSPIAAWKSPRASGVAIMWLTLHDPADSPKIATRSGSPPNDAMLRCTQSSAATWSSVP